MIQFCRFEWWDSKRIAWWCPNWVSPPGLDFRLLQAKLIALGNLALTFFHDNDWMEQKLQLPKAEETKTQIKTCWTNRRLPRIP